MLNKKQKPNESTYSLDAILKNIFEKVQSQNENGTNYIKLIELFFKGLDLKQKLRGNTPAKKVQNTIIKGLDTNKL